MPFNSDVLLMMIFTIVMVLIIGGFIVAVPIIRRLGVLTDQWARGRHALSDGTEAEAMRRVLTEIGTRLTALEEGQIEIRERQEFVERLLAPGESGAAGREPGTAG
jgi:hypothetical protein